MEHLALYRKYRSKDFNEIIGQDHIVKSLINQIKTNTVSHAYLFCGTRGTGKTSIAKIFAKAINCPNSINGNPCNKCEVCNALGDANNIDILEIDAASNNKVDEVREIREKVKYPPIVGKYKVYIIDEVHMLTDSAFNALLKTLEEPPQYVVFILATTEVQKIPQTILSRCMRFDFKLVDNVTLNNHIKNIFNKEKIKYEDEAVNLIASLGEGSVRDALSIADMCVAFSAGDVTYDSVLNAVGGTDKKTLYQLATFIVEKKSTNMLSIINKISNIGKNITQLSKDLLHYFKDIAVVKTCDDYRDILVMPEDVLALLKELSNKIEHKRLLNILKQFSALENEFRYTSDPKTLLEVTLLNLVNME